MVKKNTCVFISGFGSNLKSLINFSRNTSSPVKISLVVTNNPNACGILHAKKNSIPHLVINTKRRDYENILLTEIRRRKITLICLAGYMQILSKRFINSFHKKIINIHPSLLPKFKGLNTFERALKNKEKKTGCTVHFVTAKLDSGKVILRKSFFIDNKDNIKTLKEKTHKLEHKAFPEAIISIYRYN